MTTTKSNIGKAIEVAEKTQLPGRKLHLDQAAALVLALEEAGLIAPHLRVVKTVDQLELLDRVSPRAMALAFPGGLPESVEDLYGRCLSGEHGVLPAVLMVSEKTIERAEQILAEELNHDQSR